MLTEPQYRTFDELLDSVRIDLKTFDLEGMFEPQQLLKVAIRVNYELGLKVNPTRSKILEVHKNKTRLPDDFYTMNFALVCNGKRALETPQTAKSFTEGLLEGVVLSQMQSEAASAANAASSLKLFTTLINIIPGDNRVDHLLASTDVVVQATLQDGSLVQFDFVSLNENTIVIKSQLTTTMNNVKLVVVGGYKAATASSGNSSTTITGGNSANLITDSHGNTMVRYNQFNKQYDYKTLLPLKLDRHRDISPDCFNLGIQSHYSGSLKNGFLQTNFTEGVVFINYQSLMEDDDGNLLVLDHPLCNEYYEYAIKQRLLENLFMSGENVANMLQLTEQKLRIARTNALSFINTPDFREMKQVWEMNRKAQYHNYYNMFKSNSR